MSSLHFPLCVSLPVLLFRPYFSRESTLSIITFPQILFTSKTCSVCSISPFTFSHESPAYRFWPCRKSLVSSALHYPASECISICVCVSYRSSNCVCVLDFLSLLPSFKWFQNPQMLTPLSSPWRLFDLLKAVKTSVCNGLWVLMNSLLACDVKHYSSAYQKRASKR